MPTISLTLPVSGTVITAGLHSTNYTTIQNLVNGGLDNNNVSTTAGIDGTKLANNVARIYDRVTSTNDINTTASMTSVYSKSISGNDMGTNRMLRLLLEGDYLHNNVNTDTLTAQVLFGGSVVWQASLGSIGGTSSAGRHPWRWEINVQNKGATNSQFLSGQLHLTLTTDTAPTTGIGGASAQFEVPFASNGLLTVDTTTAQTLEAKIQWSASSVNNSFRLFSGVLELV